MTAEVVAEAMSTAEEVVAEAASTVDKVVVKGHVHGGRDNGRG